MRTTRSGQAAVMAVLVAATIAFGAASPEQTKTSEKGTGASTAPACLRCGATCGLEPICVCSSGTKKKPHAEYEVECERFCVAGCSSAPWPFGRRAAVECTSCAEESCDCPGRVRTKKLLRKTMVDEEICVVERSVAYLCGSCSGRGSASCCDTRPAERRPSWWSKLTPWWP